MTNLKDSNGKATIVEDVVLTKTAINVLKNLQSGNNDLLEIHCESVVDAICYLARLSDEEMNEGKKKEITELVISLTFVRDIINQLKKP